MRSVRILCGMALLVTLRSDEAERLHEDALAPRHVAPRQPRLPEVVIPPRPPARGEHDVGAVGGLEEPRLQLVEEIGDYPVVDDPAAGGLPRPTEREAVGS